MKQKLFSVILSFVLIFSLCLSPTHAATPTEWTGQAVNGGEWFIPNDKVINIDDSSADIYFENATLTIQDGATLNVNQGTLRFNNSVVKGTVNVNESGIIRPWGPSTKMDHVILNDSGTIWGAPNASLTKLEINDDGVGDIFGTSINELIQNNGTLFVTDKDNVYGRITEYTQYGGILNCKNGGTIDTANLYGGQAVILTEGRSGSIDQVNLKDKGDLYLSDEEASVNHVNMEWGENFRDPNYPCITNKGLISNFSGSGGYVKNFATITHATMLTDTSGGLGVDFRNGSYYGTPGNIESLTMDDGFFFNGYTSSLNTAILYDGDFSHFSSEPISRIEMLLSKNPGSTDASPNGATLRLTGPAILDTLVFSQGTLIMFDEEGQGAVINTLSKTKDFAGVIDKDRFSEIKSELTGMATLTWDQPLNGNIKVTLDGSELTSGSMIADGSIVQVTTTTNSDTYKLKADSLKANDTQITEGSYAVNGNTIFSAAFILKDTAQSWDGSASITIADKYEITTPIIINNDIRICSGAEIYFSDKGSLTIYDSGSLTNLGVIHGLVTLSPKRTRIAKDNLINSGTIKEVKVEAGSRLNNKGVVESLELAGGNANNYKQIDTLIVKSNGTINNINNDALIKEAALVNGLINNENTATIKTLKIEGGLANNIGATIENAYLLKGKIINSNTDATISTIKMLEATSGTLENKEGAIIDQLNLVQNNNVTMENKGIIKNQTGSIISGYELKDNTITVTENKYFNSDPNITITWNPVTPIGSNTVAPVEYRLRMYENENLSGNPIWDVTYDANSTWGGASGSKLKHNTTYYMVLEAKVIGGNVEKDKIFTYQTKSITTLPNPEEIGALNVDKITLKAGETFQFKAYNALGHEVTTIPLSWSVQAYPGDKLTSKETHISKDGLLTVGADETAKQLLIACSRDDGYMTTYTAIVTITNDAPTLYPITVYATEGGKAWATMESAEEGAYVLLFAEAEDGYQLDYWETNAGEILLPTNDIPFYRLIIPNEAVIVTAHFTKIPESDIEITDNTPKTGDLTSYSSIIMLLMSGLILITLLKKKEQ